MKRLLVLILVTLAAAVAALWVHPPLQSLAAQWLPALAPYLPDQNAHGSAGAAGQQSAQPKAKGKGQPAPPVVAAVVAVGEMPVILSAPGTVEARATATVRPRVDGQISEVLFKEGDLVKAGQVLFRLDDRLVKAQIAQAEAAIKKDEATLVDAQNTYARRAVLVEKKIVSDSAMDTARATMEALKAVSSAIAPWIRPAPPWRR